MLGRGPLCLIRCRTSSDEIWSPVTLRLALNSVLVVDLRGADQLLRLFLKKKMTEKIQCGNGMEGDTMMGRREWLMVFPQKFGSLRV